MIQIQTRPDLYLSTFLYRGELTRPELKLGPTCAPRSLNCKLGQLDRELTQIDLRPNPNHPASSKQFRFHLTRPDHNQPMSGSFSWVGFPKQQQLLLCTLLPWLPSQATTTVLGGGSVLSDGESLADPLRPTISDPLFFFFFFSLFFFTNPVISSAHPLRCKLFDKQVQQHLSSPFATLDPF